MARKNELVESVCPRCRKSFARGNTQLKTCPSCLAQREVDRRLDTKRRPASRSFCANCMEDASFEYFLAPPRWIRKKGTTPKAKIWCVLCDTCFNIWLETGVHRVYDYPRSPSIGYGGRPLTQDERDELRVKTTVDKSTGLLTYNWRRP